MALPININELINGRTVEWERVEFKKGWNPLKTLHSICAFANDFNNWGGGYIIIGIQEKQAKPVLPPEGLTATQVDSVQKELLRICHRLRPQYFPVVEPVEFKGKTILIIWCPGGAARPYKAPERLVKKANYTPYIRRAQKNNGSPKPVFETDEERNYFATILRINPNARVSEQSIRSQPELQPESQPESLAGRVLEILSASRFSKSEIAENLNQKSVSGQLNKVTRELFKKGCIEYTIPDRPKSRLQKYKITETGRQLLEKLKKEKR